MKSTAVRETTTDGFREVGTMVIEGREFAANGAFLSDDPMGCVDLVEG